MVTEIEPAELIKILCESGCTQLEITQGTGISQATISRIATGVHDDPRMSTVKKLRAFAVTRLDQAPSAI